MLRIRYQVQKLGVHTFSLKYGNITQTAWNLFYVLYCIQIKGKTIDTVIDGTNFLSVALYRAIILEIFYSLYVSGPFPI